MQKRWTKLSILAFSHQVFDPVGCLIPIMVSAKAILQKCWKNKLDWKDDLTAEIDQEWRAWVADVCQMTPIAIPRVLFPGYPSEEDIRTKELHIFADAADVAYCAVAYTKQNLNNKGNVSFCLARGRLGPARGKKTTPRMELMALDLGSKLAVYIAPTLNIEKERVFLWSDSTTALQWTLQFRPLRVSSQMRGQFTNQTLPDSIQCLDKNFILDQVVRAQWCSLS